MSSDYPIAYEVDKTSTWPFTARVKSLPLDVDNQEMFNKYLKPYIWEGWLWLDGGWSNYKDEVGKLMMGDPVSGFTLPFLLKPHNEIEQGYIQVGDQTTVTSIEKDRKWHEAFPGEQYKILLHLITAIRELGIEKQEYVLNSYFSTQVPDGGEPIFQLKITVTKNEIQFKVLRGKWLPSFDDVLPASGWAEK